MRNILCVAIFLTMGFVSAEDEDPWGSGERLERRELPCRTISLNHITEAKKRTNQQVFIIALQHEKAMAYTIIKTLVQQKAQELAVGNSDTGARVIEIAPRDELEDIFIENKKKNLKRDPEFFSEIVPIKQNASTPVLIPEPAKVPALSRKFAPITAKISEVSLPNKALIRTPTAIAPKYTPILTPKQFKLSSINNYLFTASMFLATEQQLFLKTMLKHPLEMTERSTIRETSQIPEEKIAFGAISSHFRYFHQNESAAFVAFLYFLAISFMFGTATVAISAASNLSEPILALCAFIPREILNAFDNYNCNNYSLA